MIPGGHYESAAKHNQFPSIACLCCVLGAPDTLSIAPASLNLITSDVTSLPLGVRPAGSSTALCREWRSSFGGCSPQHHRLPDQFPLLASRFVLSYEEMQVEDGKRKSGKQKKRIRWKNERERKKIRGKKRKKKRRRKRKSMKRKRKRMNKKKRGVGCDGVGMKAIGGR